MSCRARLSLFALLGWCALVSPVPAMATHFAPVGGSFYDAVLDTDNNPGTGCDVTTVDGTFGGFELIIRTEVDRTVTPPMVVNVSSLGCSAGVFGAPVLIDTSGWPVGLNGGVGGLDSVETYFDEGLLGGATTVRAGFIAVSPAGEDTLFAGGVGTLLDFSHAGGGAEPIPVNPGWALVLLSLALGIGAVVMLRRGGHTFVVLMLAVGLLGVVYAQNQLWGDWFLVPDDPPADVADPGVDLVNVYYGHSPITGYFRFDVTELESTAPVAGADGYTLLEDGSLNQAAPGVLGNDSDPKVAGLTAILNSTTANGSLILNADGSFTYTSNADFFGSDSFTYHANDGTDDSNITTVTITVTPVNDQPSFTAVNPAAVNQDSGPQTVSNWATFNPGAANEAGQTATYQVSNISNPALFSAGPAVDASGNLTYTPAAGQFGTSTIDVTVVDNGGTANGGVDTSVTQTFTITVVATGIPIANNDTYNTLPNAPIEDGGTFNVIAPGVLGNDTDPKTAGLTAILDTTTSSGVLVLNANGSFTYTPNADFFGIDSFTYHTNDGTDNSAPATVTLDVQPVNDQPSFTAAGNPAAVNEDSGANNVVGWITSFVAGPANEAAQTPTYLITNVSNPALFAAGPAVAANGTLSYTPAANANGTSTFDVAVQDSGGTANGGVDTSPVQNFTITVNVVNDAPTFTAADPPAVNEGAGAQTVIGWASGFNPGPADEAAQTLVGYTVSAVSNPALFSVQPAVDNAGNLTYTPAADIGGTSTFSVTVQDNGGVANGGVDTSAIQTFTITVNEVNDQPSFTAMGNPAAVNEDAGAQNVVGWVTAFNPGSPNESGQTPTYLVSGVTNPGLFSAGPAVAANGTLSFTPAPNVSGASSFNVAVQDNGGTANGGVDTSAAQTFTITVNPVNDAPSYTAGNPAAVNEDSGAQSVPGWVTSFVPGPADETAQTPTYLVSAVSNPGLFAAGPAVASNGTLSFTPALNAFGSSTFNVAVQDNGGTANGGVDTSPIQNFTITVNPVNDPPSFTAANPPAVTEGDPAQTVVGWVTSASVGPANEAGQTLSYIVSNVVNGALLTAGPAVASNGTLTYTPAASGTGTVTFDVQAMDNGGGADTSAAQNFSITINTANIPPSVTNDTFDTIGNTQLEVGAAPSLTPAVYFNGNVLANDSDGGDGPMALAVNTTGTYATTNGGSVTIAANGSFSYRPPVGSLVADSFGYDITDDGGTTTANGTVTINIQQMVWYVENDSAAGGTGTSSSPFDTLAEAETAALANHTIYVHTGDGTTTGQNAGISLKTGQRLHGEAVDLAFAGLTLNGVGPATHTLHTATVRPQIGNGAGDAVTVAANVGNGSMTGVEIRGLGISASADGIDVSAVDAANATVLIDNNVTASVAGVGIRLTNSGSGLHTATVRNNTLAATGNAFDASTSGTGDMQLTYSLNSATSANVSGAAVNIDDVAGAGTLFIVGFADNVVSSGSAGDGIAVRGAVFDADPADADFDPVNYGLVVVGSGQFNRVAKSAVILGTAASPVQGHLQGSFLEIYAAAGAGISSVGTAVASGGPPFTAGFYLGGGTTGFADGGPLLFLDTLTVGLSPSAPARTNAGTTQGISLRNVAGQITNTGTQIFNSAGTGLEIIGGTVDFTGLTTISRIAGGSAVAVSGGHTGFVEIDGNVTSTAGGTATQLSFANADGAYVFNGAVSLTSTSGSGIAADAATGGVLDFNGDLDITTTTGTGVNMAGGTLAVASGTTTVNSGSGQAVLLSGVTMGTGGTTFNTVTSGGGANGVSLNNVTAANGFTVSSGTLAGNTTAGVNISNASGTLTFGTLNIDAAAAGTGIAIAGANGTVNVSNGSGSTNVDGGTTGISVNGTGTINIGTGAGTAAIGASATTTGAAFASPGGSATVNYDGTITNSSGRAVDIQNRTGGTMTFSGLITETGTGVFMNGNTGSTMTYTGGMGLTTTTNPAFTATGGGTVNVTGTNTATTTTATAVNIANTTIGGSGVTFQSVSVNGASYGVILNTAGSGGFTITGTGTTDASGGTIQNITNRGFQIVVTDNISLSNVSLVNATTANGVGTCSELDNSGCNAPIYLGVVNTVTLDNVDINGSVQQGLNGIFVANFSLLNSTIQAAGDAVAEGGMRMYNLSGNVAITNSVLTSSTGGDRVARIVNDTGNMNLTVTGSTFQDTQSSGTNGADGLEIIHQSAATSDINIVTSSFLRNRTNGLQVHALNTSNVRLDVTGSTFDRGAGIGIGMDLAADNTANLDFNVIGNPTINSNGGSAINVFADGTATMEGRINNNPDIQAGGGITSGFGISVQANTGSNVAVEISGNTVSNIGFDAGIRAIARLGTGRLDATINSNSVTVDALNSLYDIWVQADDTNTTCANVTNNTASGVAIAAFRQRTAAAGATVLLEGFNTNATTTWNNNGNTLAGSVSSSNLGTLGGGTCTTVTHTLP